MKKLAAIAAILAIVGFALELGYLLLLSPTPIFQPPKIVSIKKGQSLTAAARLLAHSGVIRNSAAFVLYAELTGQASRLKPGDYEFKGGEGIPLVLRHLVNGDFMVVTVIVPEGMTVHQIGERMEAAGLTCAGQFDRAATDGPIPRALGLEPLGAEGFLFPATYRFSPRDGASEILTAMLRRFYQILTPQVEERMFELGMDDRQVVTMASIIEKEAKEPGERPVIASVFYNRLERGMPLQSDPTAQYNLAGEMARAAVAVRTASAFNTYTIAGLPPGPIANPGLSSIEAALYPAHTDYLYFVARNDGTHIFSRSFKEHERAIEEVKRMGTSANGPRG